MKYDLRHVQASVMLSSPARGTWVEIIEVLSGFAIALGRLPHGGRGLKCAIPDCVVLRAQRSSPARGTWVEIRITILIGEILSVVSRTGDVG